MFPSESLKMHTATVIPPNARASLAEKMEWKETAVLVDCG